jgi:malate dehydrogenase (oxaloacetate-decarboxylating)(NADP+)
MRIRQSHEHEELLGAQDTNPGHSSPALTYHAQPMPGKFATVPTKPLASSVDLALAYSPGVADACTAIAQNPDTVSQYTMRQHLVAVISNGSAVLGLGNIGPLAAKPVMEGKAVLFQHFSGLNAIDLEIDAQDPEKLIEIIAALAPSFGGINLEDIKAPECFRIESALKERLKIPVFHDDQHGTAITVAAGLINALELVGKTLQTSRCVVVGAGSGALACVGLLVELGMPKHHITLCDTKGVVHTLRQDLSPHKRMYAQETPYRSLVDVMAGADILLGLSGPGTVTSEMVMVMADRPIIFALANPIPEIWPQDVLSVRPDAYVGTGRSDLPNQVNNILCFPYMFRGAMDAGAVSIDLSMKKACVQALSQLAKKGFVDCSGVYHGEIHDFSPTYFIPKPFDARLGVDLPLAVAGAAIASGQAAPFDLDYYRKCLIQRAYADFFVFKTLLSQSPKAHSDIPTLCYIVETKDNRLPLAVHAAARLIQTHGLANVQFVGNHEVIRDQLAKDSVLAAAPVLPPIGPIQNLEARPGIAYVAIVSGVTHQEGCVQGGIYEGALHLYGPEKPSQWIIKMLQACGSVFSNAHHSMVGDHDGGVHVGLTPHGIVPHDSFDKSIPASRTTKQPHFGGLQANPRIETVWHLGPFPSLLGEPFFGPMVLGPQDIPCVSDSDKLRCVLEHSSWALLKQEVAM